MIVTLRGVRGSIPVPGPNTVKYGGNTTCIEIITDTEDRIIIDGGSGIRDVGLAQCANLPIKVSIFLTHTHWDHIQGLPFYTPFFIPGNTIDIYGAFDPVYRKDLRAILSQQMEYCYFPVRECELKATINYHKIQEYQSIQVGSAKVTPILLNHPVLNYGYLIESRHRRFFFTGDYEPATNIYTEEDEDFGEYQEMVDEQNQSVIDFIEGVDILLCDSQYTAEEYPTKKGWGHGSYESSMMLAKKACVGQLLFTHHDPTRTDAQLDTIMEDVLANQSIVGNMNLCIAQEGQTFQL